MKLYSTPVAVITRLEQDDVIRTSIQTTSKDGENFVIDKLIG